MHLKKITISPGVIVKCFGHWLLSYEILGSNPFVCNFFMIKFSEFIDKLLLKNSNEFGFAGKYLIRLIDY